MIFTAIALLPEVTIPVPSLNDNELHYLFIQRASDALTNGQNVFDFWLPQVEAGFPQFFYYQHLPALVVVGIQRLSLGSLDLLTTLNLVRYVLLVGLPLSVFASMRMFGFSVVAAAIAAAASTLLSGDFRYGFEYDSYIWRGFGLFTQLWAMHLTFLTVAAMYRALHRGRYLWIAALLLGLLVLTHLIYTYMTAMAIVLMALWGLNRANLKARVVRLAIVGAFAGAISSYMWLPLLSQVAYLNATPYLQHEKYDSYGAGPILTWMFTGELFDHGRLPIMTALLGIGVVAALLSRMRVAAVAVGLFLMWLVVYFGRPTLGPSADWFPLHAGLLFHRFIGGVSLAGIMLIGVGGASIWGLFRPHLSRVRVVVASGAFILLLVPAIGERATMYSFNTLWMQRAYDAIQNDFDAKAILANLKILPPGRVYTGLPANWGNTMTFGDLRFWDLIAFDGIESLSRPSESLSLNADYIWDFDDHLLGEYDLWNVKYVVAPSSLAVASFLTPILKTTKYTLYQAPTSGYAEYVTITARTTVTSQSDLFQLNRTWERTKTLPAQHLYTRYDYASSAQPPGATTSNACPGGGRTDFEAFKAGQINLVVECPAASTLVIKTTFHPDWQVRVDGKVVPDFMVSPSFIGISMPPGKHTVDVVYVDIAIKTPLLILGAIALLILLDVRRWLDRLAEVLAAPRQCKPPADEVPATGATT